ncbi:MAG: ParA family protein [Candidatus Ornithospirochaeta sp.]
MKRLTLFLGHYGSGKTNLAVNWALKAAADGIKVSIADLDIVNPYFRTKDSQKELEEAGVKVIALPFANSSVDLPSLPSEAYGLVEDKSRYGILDIGGDDRGAYALGRFAPYIAEEDDYDMFYVVNFFRPLTQNARDAYQCMLEIEWASGLKFSGIINNSNLGAETTVEDILSTFSRAEELSVLSGKPVVAVTAEETVAGEGMVPLRLQKRIFD